MLVSSLRDGASCAQDDPRGAGESRRQLARDLDPCLDPRPFHGPRPSSDHQVCRPSRHPSLSVGFHTHPTWNDSCRRRPGAGGWEVNISGPPDSGNGREKLPLLSKKEGEAIPLTLLHMKSKRSSTDEDQPWCRMQKGVEGRINKGTRLQTPS